MDVVEVERWDTTGMHGVEILYILTICIYEYIYICIFMYIYVNM